MTMVMGLKLEINALNRSSTTFLIRGCCSMRFHSPNVIGLLWFPFHVFIQAVHTEKHVPSLKTSSEVVTL